MSFRIHTSAQAEADIERIFTWLAARSPQGAARWYESFWDAAERLSEFPHLAGPSAKEANPALDRMREDPNAEARKQAQAASDRIKSEPESSPDNGNARKTASI
jgi:plasmid stabilization system protein ParE